MIKQRSQETKGSVPSLCCKTFNIILLIENAAHLSMKNIILKDIDLKISNENKYLDVDENTFFCAEIFISKQNILKLSWFS